MFCSDILDFFPISLCVFLHVCCFSELDSLIIVGEQLIDYWKCHCITHRALARQIALRGRL